nr:QRFP-like peptide receptor [Onthophagus taurus]
MFIIKIKFVATKNGNILPANSEDSLKYLSFLERSIFFSVFFLVYIIALSGNIAAIYVTLNRKHRFIQKTLIISLASSDLIMATAYTVNYLETFSHDLVNWTMGVFLCGAIPFLQIFGVIASSGALVAIALDRYRNVVHVTKQRWNPSFSHCIFMISTMWIICAVISYPITIWFEHKEVNVYFSDGRQPPIERMFMCLSMEKDKLKIYYIFIAATIFLPLFVIFTWLYCNIAKLVWKHRKPLSVRFEKNQENSLETVTSQIKTDDSISTIKIMPKSPPIIMPKQKPNSVKRKIRTFKIIIVLMMAFLLCRIPYWTFNILKLINTYREHHYWILTYLFNGLALLNCAMNPFLYTFLNETVDYLSRITKILNDFTCQVCCCCFSNTEFEDFGKENPFMDNYNNFENKQCNKK